MSIAAVSISDLPRVCATDAEVASLRAMCAEAKQSGDAETFICEFEDRDDWWGPDCNGKSTLTHHHTTNTNTLSLKYSDTALF